MVGGPGLVASLIDAGLLDELRLIVHPVLAGGGTPFFGGITRRDALGLVAAEPTASGRVQLTYRLALTDPPNGERSRVSDGRGVDFNHRIIEEFRAERGRVGGPLAGTPILLLHHIGARSGIERVTPLAYTLARRRPLRDRRLQRRIPDPPGLVPQPQGAPGGRGRGRQQRRSWCAAEELNGAARDALWPGLVAASPSLRDYEAKTGRRFRCSC